MAADWATHSGARHAANTAALREEAGVGTLRARACLADCRVVALFPHLVLFPERASKSASGEHDHRDAAATASAGLANCQTMRRNLGMVQTGSVKAPSLSVVAEEPADKPCPWNVKKTTLGRAGAQALK